MKTHISKLLLVVIVLTIFGCSSDDNVEIEQGNEAPILTAQSFTVAEDIADNLPIGTVETSDPDGDALSFSISTNDDDLFEINDEGVLSLDDLQTLDYEMAQSHTITVAVSDGGTTTEAMVTINVTDVDDTSFVSTWETTTAGEMITLSTRANEFSYDYTIDWGDGTIQTGRTGDATHIYETADTYTVSISGTFPAMLFNQSKLRSIERWGNIQWQTMESAFANVTATLVINATDTPDLSQVTIMSSMFAFSEFNQDISAWDVGNVTTMDSMFLLSEFNQDISAWDVGNVTTMNRMFRDSEFNQDISTWDVSNVTIMSSMFAFSEFNQDLSAWDVGNVTSMNNMFGDSEFNQDISAWDVGNVTSMNDMFRDSEFNQDISAWDVGNVTACEGFAANSPLTAGNTPNFTNCMP